MKFECQASKLLKPFRTVGLVTDGKPFALNALGEEDFVVMTIEKSFQIFKVSKLSLSVVSPALTHKIEAVAAKNHFTYTACQGKILVWERIKQVATLGAHPGGLRVRQLLALGSCLLSLAAAAADDAGGGGGGGGGGGDGRGGGGELRVFDAEVRRTPPPGTRRKGARADGGSGSEAEAEEEEEGGSSSSSEEEQEEESGGGGGGGEGGGAPGEGGRLLALVRFGPDFTPTCLAHPQTYLNKVVVGSAEGGLRLVNVRSARTVHRFAALAPGGGAVTCVRPSPALDVAAVGRSKGSIALLHLREDRVLFTLTHEAGNPVHALTFRTDAGAGASPMLASADGRGNVHLWDLAKRRLAHTVAGAHVGPASGAAFLPGQPLLLTQGARDNSLKAWVLDAPDGSARLLRAREGHAPPGPRAAGLRFYGDPGSDAALGLTLGEPGRAEGLQLLSAGGDGAFRALHAARDAQSRELSQGPLRKKARKHREGRGPAALAAGEPEHDPLAGLRLSPVVAFAAAAAREGDWDNLVTCHAGDPTAYTWSWKRRALGRHRLRQPGWPRADAPSSSDRAQDPRWHATAVALSACGNFALVGTRGGAVYKYNMQSGEPRGSYPASATAAAAAAQGGKKKKQHELHPASAAKLVADRAPKPPPAAAAAAPPEEDHPAPAPAAEGAAAAAAEGHTGQVTGLGMDAVNGTVASAGLDGRLLFWDFATHRLLGAVHVGVGVARMALFRPNSLLAIAGDDHQVRVYDLTTRRLVRRLAGHSAAVLDLAFSPDGRRLFSVGADSDLRAWDLPTGRCQDWVRFRKPATAVCCSPSGEFVATAHAGALGVALWADRSYFARLHLGQPPKEPVLMDEPAAVGEDQGALGVTVTEPDEEEEGGGAGGAAPEESRAQKGAGALTLARLPAAHWQTLFNLELIKARNRPVEAPRAPERAPFFLPTVRREGVTPGFLREEEAAAAAAAAREEGGSGGESAALKRAREEERLLQEMASLPSGGGGTWADHDGEEEEGGGGGGGGWPEEEEEEGGGEGRPGAGQQRGASKSKLISSFGEISESSNSKILKFGQINELPRSRLCVLMDDCDCKDIISEEDFFKKSTEAIDFLMSLGASGVDVELRSLGPGLLGLEGTEAAGQGQGGEQERRRLGAMADALEVHLRRGHRFEVVQAYLNRFLRLYAGALAASPALLAKVRVLAGAQRRRARRLQRLIQEDLCLLQFFGDLQA